MGAGSWPLGLRAPGHQLAAPEAAAHPARHSFGAEGIAARCCSGRPPPLETVGVHGWTGGARSGEGQAAWASPASRVKRRAGHLRVTPDRASQPRGIAGCCTPTTAHLDPDHGSAGGETGRGGLGVRKASRSFSSQRIDDLFFLLPLSPSDRLVRFSGVHTNAMKDTALSPQAAQAGR